MAKKRNKSSAGAVAGAAASSLSDDRHDPPIVLDSTQDNPPNPRPDSPPRSPVRVRIPSPPQGTLFLEVPETPMTASLSTPSNSPPRAPVPGPSPSRRKNLGKGKKRILPSKKAQEKFSILSDHLRAVPFAPTVKGNVYKHEDLYRALGLWEFIQLPPETDIRTDLLAQLIANYSPDNRSSTIDGKRFAISRADLARALHLPWKKGQQETNEADLELFLREDSIRSLMEFIGNWFVVQEGIVPQEFVTVGQQVKSGQVHKVDWAGLIWAQVEKELKEIPKSGECFYCYHASYLQCLIRNQKPEIMLQSKSLGVELESELGSQAEQEHGHAQLSPLIEEEEEKTHTPERVQAGDAILDPLVLNLGRKANIVDDTVERGKQFVYYGTDLGMEHCMQRCSTDMSQSSELKDILKEEAKAEGEGTKYQEDIAVKFSSFGGVSSYDLLQSMEADTRHYCSTSIPYTNQAHDDEPQDMEEDLMRMRTHAPAKIGLDCQLGSPHLYQNEGKRGFHDAGEDTDWFTQKRMRSNVHWEHGGLSFENCMKESQAWMARGKMLYDEKIQQNMDARLQIHSLNETLQEKDAFIGKLQKGMIEYQQRGQAQLKRYDHEVQVLSRLVNGYKNALGKCRSEFAEYRKQFPHVEESLYKDVPGNGGIVLSINELERQRLQNEEDIRHIIVQMLATFENACISKLNGHNTSLVELIKRVDAVAIDIQRIKEIQALKHLST